MRLLKKYLFVICISTFAFGIAQEQVIDNVKNTKEIVIAKADNPDQYSSSLDLDDDRKQLIMAGQNYHTNYGIYAEIKTAPSYKGNNFRTLEHIKFEIVNYKPTYFIGIDSVVITESKMKNDFMLKIYTKGLSENRTFELNKAQLGHIHMEKGSYLHSERTLNPLFVNFDSDGKPRRIEDGRIDSEPENGQVFDFEFWYKDGLHVVRKKDYDKEEDKKQIYMDEIVSTMPGVRCKESFNKVIFSE